MTTKGKIERILIKRFQGIKEADITEIGDINLIVARNGSGKTTLLEALFFISDLFSASVPGDHNRPDFVLYSNGRHRQGKLNWLLNRRNLGPVGQHSNAISVKEPEINLSPGLTDGHWYKNDTSMPIEFQVFSKAWERVSISVRNTGNTTDVSLDELWKWKTHGKVLKSTSKAILDQYKSYRAAGIMGKVPQSTGEASLARAVTSAVEKRVLQFFDPAVFLDSGLLLNSDVERNMWEKVLSSGYKERLIDLFNQVYPLKISSIDYSPGSNTLFVTPRDSKYGLRMDRLGTGMRIGFRLLLIASYLKDTMLLIEEFDAYQHPDSLNTLVQALIGIAKQNNIQVFATTHRQESIKAFLKHGEGIDGRIIVLSLDSEGLLKTGSIPFDEARSLFDAGVDFRNLEDFQE